MANQDDFKNDKYKFLGSVNTLHDLQTVDVSGLEDNKIPFLWVMNDNKFFYFINNMWTPDKSVEEWVEIYRDDSLVIHNVNGELKLSLLKELEDIVLNRTQVIGILHAIKGVNKLVVSSVYDALERGMSSTEIVEMEDGLLLEFVTEDQLNDLIDDVKYWINIKDQTQRTQVDFDHEVDEDEEEIELVELVNDEGVDVELTEELETVLEPMDMVKIYNEIVEDRKQQVHEEIEVEGVVDDDEFEIVEMDDELSEFELLEDVLEDTEVVEENEEDTMNNIMITDVFCNGCLLAHVKPGAVLPSRFVKISEHTQINDEGVVENPTEIIMEDATGNEGDVFDEHDLIVVLKARINALMNVTDEKGVKVFANDNQLHMVMNKLTEAQMWLDLWSRSK